MEKSKPLLNLLKFALKERDPFAKDIAIIALRYYNGDTQLTKVAMDILPDKLTIDLWELDSLVNKDRYEFPDNDVEKVEVELDE